jgi:hypothetical protein
VKTPAPPVQPGSDWGPWLWRFVTGQHLDGRRRSDATFFRRGTHADPHYWGRGGESWWALLAGWQRAAVRVAPVVLAYEWITHRAATEWVLALVAGPAAGLLAVRGIRWTFAFGHYRTKVLPLAWALGPMIGIPAAAKPKTWLDVPVNYGTDPAAEIVIYPPDDFTGSDGERSDIERTVVAKLGIEAPDKTYKLNGRKPSIVFTKSDPPPPMVTADDIRAAIAAAKPSEVVLGLGKKDQVIALDLDSETPHVGQSMGTGDGKSTVAMNMAAQLAHHGALIVILDYKLLSHMWARGLPNVCYAGTPQEIHEALVWLGCDTELRESELTRRKHVGLASADLHGNITADVGPRIFVIAEELNATVKILKRYWRSIGGKGPSPALEGLDEVAFTGRQLLANVDYIGQRLSAKATGSDGSADVRENIGAIVFHDAKESTWKMLADGHTQPPKSGHKGRYQVVTRHEVREVQGALWTPEQARAFAVSGTVGVPRFDMPLVDRRGAALAVVGQTSSTDHDAPEQPIVIGPTPPVLPSGGGVKLRDAVDAGLFVSIEAARRAAHRQQWEPVGGDKTSGFEYALADLHAYQQSKGRR